MLKLTHLSFLILCFGLIVAALMGRDGSTVSAQTAIGAESPANEPTTREVSAINGGNCRYGVAQLGADPDIPFINEIDAGWKVDFNVRFERDNTDSARYSPTIRIKTVVDSDDDPTNNAYWINGPQMNDDPGQLGALVTANPGRLWLIGNEVERLGQDGLYPQVYARAYHDLYHFIKARDASARIANGGLVMITPARLQYLDIVLETYQELYGTRMPVDVWNTHLYVFGERILDSYDDPAAGGIALGTDPELAIYENNGGDPLVCAARSDVLCFSDHDEVDIVKNQVTMMREWMHTNDEGNKPLIISEYGVLWPYDDEGDDDPNTCFLRDENGNCFEPERVQRFVTDSFEMLESYRDPELGYAVDDHRMVQQWLWFGTIGEWYDSWKLINLDKTALSPVGETFRDGVRAHTKHTNIVPIESVPAVVYTDGSGTASAEIKVKLRNTGNMAALSSFDVGFYRNSGLDDVIGFDSLDAGLEGCTMEEFEATVTWDNLTPGIHYYWAYANVGHPISESDLSDNTTMGIVIVDPEYQLFFPTLRR